MTTAAIPAPRLSGGPGCIGEPSNRIGWGSLPRCSVALRPMNAPLPPLPHPAHPLLTPSRQGTRGLASGLPTPSQGVPWGSPTPFRGVPGDLPTPFRFAQPGSRPSSPAPISQARQPRFLRVASLNSIRPLRCRQLLHFQRRRAPVPVFPVGAPVQPTSPGIRPPNGHRQCRHFQPPAGGPGRPPRHPSRRTKPQHSTSTHLASLDHRPARTAAPAPSFRLSQHPSQPESSPESHSDSGEV